MLTVVTAPTSRLLTTLDRVKLELGLSGTMDDAYLNAKIDAVSDQIATFIGRELGRRSVVETFWPHQLGPHLVLSGWPVVEVTLVSSPVGSLAYALPAEAWELDPAAGIIRRPSGGGLWGPFAVAVAYTCGWLMPGQEGRTLPPMIEAAAVEQIKGDWMARGRDPSVRSESVVGIGSTDYRGTSDDPSGLLPGVVGRIAPFRALRAV